MYELEDLERIKPIMRDGSWKQYFDLARLKRGLILFQSDTVNFLRSVVHFGSSYYEFTVQGSVLYNVDIKIKQDNEIESSCNCPDSLICKHVVATLFYLEELCNDEDQGAQVKSKPQHESIEDWIENLKASVNEEVGKRYESDDEYFEERYKDRVVYVLRHKLYGNDGDELIAKKATLLKNGVYSLKNTTISSTLTFMRKPKYVTNLDCEILNQMSMSNYYNNYSIDADSPGFASMVEKCGLTNRLFVEDDYHETKVRPYAFGEPRYMMPKWQANEEGMLKPSVVIEPAITRFIKSKTRVYIDEANREVGLIEQSHSDAFIGSWLQGPVLKPNQIDELEGLIKDIQPIEKLKKEVNKPPSRLVPVPPKQRAITGVKPVPCLSIERRDISPEGSLFINSEFLDVIVGKISFLYEGYSVPSESENSRFSIDERNMITTIERDLKLEKKWLKKVKKLKLDAVAVIFSAQVHTKYQSSYLFSKNKSANTMQWLNFLAANEEALKKEGWEINTIGDLGYVIQEYDDLYEDLGESENDWFKFDLGIECEGRKISLIPAIANALSSGMFEDYDFPKSPDARIPIPLEDNHFINFPAVRFKEILEKIQDLFQHINANGEIEVPKLRAATLVDDLDLAKADKTLADLAELGANLKNIDGLPKARVPKNLKAELRDYQLTGYQWLQFLAKYKLNGVLADDMGLGKTLQALTHILAEKNSKTKNPKKLPTLVVAPTSVIPNWCSEAEKFTPSLKILLLHGADREGLYKDISKYDIVVTSYALLQRDANIHLAQSYHIVVLDESQYIKNAATKTTKTANKLNASQRICLSGTPMENHLGELWSTFNFLMPGLLQSYTIFNSTFRRPIEKAGDTAIQTSLIRRVNPLILRRTKDVVATELPPKTIIPHYVTLNEEQVDLYETVRASMDVRVKDAISEQGFNKSHILILDALLKLRQICCHPQLLKMQAAKKVKSSGKLDYLTNLLETLIEEKRSILIFSQFTSMLKLIEDHLVKSKIPFVKITGATRDRRTPVDQFQNGEIPVFLISLKAGGTGLNLTRADTVIHYDPWWNPAVENQATDRAYRIGQKNPVFVHKLICKGTIEEQIQLLQEKKAALVESLLSNSTNKFKLDQNTLSGLFAPIDV